MSEPDNPDKVRAGVVKRRRSRRMLETHRSSGDTSVKKAAAAAWGDHLARSAPEPKLIKAIKTPTQGVSDDPATSKTSTSKSGGSSARLMISIGLLVVGVIVALAPVFSTKSVRAEALALGAAVQAEVVRIGEEEPDLIDWIEQRQVSELAKVYQRHFSTAVENLVAAGYSVNSRNAQLRADFKSHRLVFSVSSGGDNSQTVAFDTDGQAVGRPLLSASFGAVLREQWATAVLPIVVVVFLLGLLWVVPRLRDRV